MNPTDEIDDLLTRAGAQWRAEQPSAPEPDLDRILGGRRPARTRVWVPALAAASVAAIAAAALTVLPDGGKEPIAGPPQSVATSNQPEVRTAQGRSSDDLLVRPGDKVQVNGDVIAVPGKDPVFCPPLAQTAIGYLPGKEPAPSCPDHLAVRLKGFDLGRLTGPTIKGVHTGQAAVTGIWGADRSIAVQEQKPHVVPVPTPEPKLPCPPPAGGWVSKPSNVDSPAVKNFLDAHADQVFGPILHYPKGTSRGAPVVVMIGVARGDLNALKAAFEKVYDGNLCVAPVLLSRTDSERISQQVGELMSRNDLGITMGGGSGMDAGPSVVQMLVYTAEVKAALAPIGLNLLKVVPAVRPAN